MANLLPQRHESIALQKAKGEQGARGDGSRDAWLLCNTAFNLPHHIHAIDYSIKRWVGNQRDFYGNESLDSFFNPLRIGDCSM
ncbi:MAG: hypothetical protein R3C56_42245 [Pirellulaceae bacterium]